MIARYDVICQERIKKALQKGIYAVEFPLVQIINIFNIELFHNVYTAPYYYYLFIISVADYDNINCCA